MTSYDAIFKSLKEMQEEGDINSGVLLDSKAAKRFIENYIASPKWRNRTVNNLAQELNEIKAFRR